MVKDGMGKGEAVGFFITKKGDVYAARKQRNKSTKDYDTS